MTEERLYKNWPSASKDSAGPSISRESLAGGKRVELTEVSLVLDNRSQKQSCTASALRRAKSIPEVRQNPEGLPGACPFKQKGPNPVRPEQPSYRTWQRWKGEAQPAAAQMSAMDTDHAQEEAPVGNRRPREEYASTIESTNHQEIL